MYSGTVSEQDVQFSRKLGELKSRIAELEAERDEIWRKLKAIINTLEETGRKEQP
jgi:hypothetical protein